MNAKSKEKLIPYELTERRKKKQNRSNWIFYIENGPFSGWFLFAIIAY